MYNYISFTIHFELKLFMDDLSYHYIFYIHRINPSTIY